MKGRPRKATILKLLEGNRGKRRLDPESEPQPAPGDPDMPEELGEVARGKWRELCPILAHMGIQSTGNQSLIGYCMAFEKTILAKRMLNKEGRFFTIKGTDRNGNVVILNKKLHPAAREEKEGLMLMHRYMVEMGLTPAALSRIKVEKPVKNAAEERFFG